MATKKITDLTQLTDLDATDSFVVNDSGAGADKRVEFSDLQSEVLNGAAIGTSTAITELQVDNLNLNGNTFSSTDTNGNILIQPNGTGATVINESGAASDFRVEGDTDTDLLFVDASADRVGISTSSPTATLSVDGSAIFNEGGNDADFRVEGDTDTHLIFADAGNDRVGIGTSSPRTTLDVKDNLFVNIVKIYTGQAGTMTATTGTATFTFSIPGINVRTALLKFTVMTRVNNATTTNSPFAEYWFQLFKNASDVITLNGATTMFEYGFTYATHFSFADNTDKTCTITITNPTALSLTTYYKIEIDEGLGTVEFSSAATT